MNNVFSNMRSWFYKYDCIVPKNDINRPLTHLLMDGGRIHICDDIHDVFLRRLAKDINLGKKNYISENRTTIFKFITDIDFIDEYFLTDEQIQKLGKDMQKALKFLYKKDDVDAYERRVIICTTEQKNVDVDGLTYIKTGIHMIWPNIKVNQNIGLILRSTLIQYMIHLLGKRPSFNPWSDVFDYNVYTNTGLRMKGCSKLSNCKGCKNKKNKKENCSICFGVGKIDENRVYKPKMILDGNGNLLVTECELLLEDTYKMIKETSIRTELKRPNITLIDKQEYPDWINERILEQHMKKPNKRKKKKMKNNGNNFLESRRNLKIRVHIGEDDECFKAIKTFIEKTYEKHKYYGDMRVDNVYLCDHGDYYIVQTNSRYCQNVSREHCSNHIYFYISKKKSRIYQKCLSESKNKNNVRCSDYKCKGCPITYRLRDILFPDLQKKKKLNDKMNQSIEGNNHNDDDDDDDRLIDDKEEIYDVKTFPSHNNYTKNKIQDLLRNIEIMNNC